MTDLPGRECPSHGRAHPPRNGGIADGDFANRDHLITQGTSSPAERAVHTGEVAGAAPASPTKLTLSGKDNYGRPRQNFADEIAGIDDARFQKEAESYIWLSAYASNNPRSDYHWMADACYDEAARRGKPEIYTLAWEAASRSGE